MDDPRRSILQQVASGQLTPAEAAVLLSQVEPDPAPLPPSNGSGSQGGRLSRIRISGQFGTARVTGDPSVLEAIVEGPHRARREGDLLLVEGESIDSLTSGFSFSRSDRWHALAQTAKNRPLWVRMNPDIPLDIELAAGTLSIRHIRSAIRAEVSAGTARIEGFASPIDVAVASGTLRATGVLDHGASHLRCEAGTIRVHLERGSSVRVSARAGLGRVVLPEEGSAVSRAWLVGGSREATVGQGDGTLEVEASMGTVHVSAD